MMSLSKEAKLLCGITLLVVPTIMYGGWTLLGYLTHGGASPMPANLRLDDTQWALWRAGHAHAGVWTILSLLLQIFLDSARVSTALKWVARISAPVGAVLLSAGFFGLAFSLAFRWLADLGILAMLAALLITAVGLLRSAYPVTDSPGA
jgi:small-conductance mechanosensitive channel